MDTSIRLVTRIASLPNSLACHWQAKLYIWNETKKSNRKEVNNMKLAKTVFTIAVILVACYVLWQGYSEFAALIG